MYVPKILTTIAAATVLLIGGIVNAEKSSAEVIEGVDWTKKVVTATGKGIPSADSVSSAQAQAFTYKAAQAQCYRNLAEMINGVRVTGETTIDGMGNKYSKIKVNVAATIKGAKVIDKKFYGDGSCNVTMQVPVFGANNSLARAIFTEKYVVEPFPNPEGITTENFDDNTNTQNYPNGGYIMPIDNSKSPLERLSTDTTIVKGVTETNPVVKKKSVEEYAAQAKGNYTGLIVDCRGLNLQPVMSPVILNTNGTKIYGHKNLDVDKIVTSGMVDYVTDLNAVDRAGSNPLTVKAVKLENFNSNPVLSIEDSNSVLIENHATKFLKDLKVVFLFD
ncbi:MAG: hypothetical protein K6G55_07630 [Selenomonadaceae bacterium]|nr:hypothetical protein [Selenomonadaceae bacterium]